MADREYRTVILAALLHDIGKFLQRGSFSWLADKVKHPERSGEFIGAFQNLFSDVVDVPLLRLLVEHHHEGPSFRPDLSVQDLPPGRERTLAYLVSEADNLSSAERGEAQAGYQDYRTTPLAPVFARIELERPQNPTPLRYRPRPLGKSSEIKDIFPETFTEFAAGEMNRLLKDFGQHFSALSEGVNKADFDCLLAHLLGILFRYTWCVPSNTQEAQPDVSLYDHLRTTAAIAACLYQYHEAHSTLDEKAIKNDEPKFLMVIGDLSGIQSYIFDIASAGVGGVARRLRARSLFIQLLTEVAAHRILRESGIPLTNLVMQSGGKFYLLLPNLSKVREGIGRAQREMDGWLLRELNGEIALNLGVIEFDRGGFKPEGGGFGAILKELNDRLQERKRQPFRECLQEGTGWDKEVFLRPTKFEGEQPCRSCGKSPGHFGKEGEKVCERCDRDTRWGRLLPRARYLAFFADEASGELPIFGYSVALWEKPLQGASPYLVLKLNDPDMSDVYRWPALPRYLANHIPRAGDFDCERCRNKQGCDDAHQKAAEDPATFRCIAAFSEGRPLLGFLKADVDNLGKAFAFGLKRDGERSYDTISRLATLSRMLDLFFSGWIEHLVSKDFRRCYTVFSGGDDLLLIGPWDEILRLAERVQGDFSRYSGNPGMTLSAGIFMNKDRFPMSRAAGEVGEAVEHAKRSGRNAIGVLNRALPWQAWALVRSEWETLKDSGEKVSSAFLYSLLQYARMWEDYRAGNVLGLKFQPLLAYNVARNLDPKLVPKLYEWVEGLLKIPVDTSARRVLDNLGLIAGLTIFSKRGGKE